MLDRQLIRYLQDNADKVGRFRPAWKWERNRQDRPPKPRARNTAASGISAMMWACSITSLRARRASCGDGNAPVARNALRQRMKRSVGMIEISATTTKAPNFRCSSQLFQYQSGPLAPS
ncbi:MAG: hypothetical protein JWP65_1348 [Ramlibacter sp.]|jgi:hypothetical protein|nr:hypothetical protein [Ramlibacter sp.]